MIHKCRHIISTKYSINKKYNILHHNLYPVLLIPYYLSYIIFFIYTIFCTNYMSTFMYHHIISSIQQCLIIAHK